MSSRGPVPPPFIFEAEVEGILRLAEGDVAPLVRRGEVWTLRASCEGCVFSVAGACRHYDQRPFDCRLFPFDIEESATGELIWVMYTNRCHLPGSLEDGFGKARSLLRSLDPHVEELRSFARYGRSTLCRLPKIELGPVELSHVDEISVAAPL